MQRLLPKVWSLAVALVAIAMPGFALGGFAVTDIPAGDFTEWASTPNANLLVGDFNGDGRADIALVGSSQTSTLPVAFSNGDGSFRVTNLPIMGFGSLATVAGVKVLVGDFNGDGRADIALTGPSSWTSVPVAFSNGDGSFNVTNLPTSFAIWASNPGVEFLVGDWNGDGKTDLAVTGPSGWPVLPVAFSNGDGSFNVTTVTTFFATLAATPNAKPLVGDFNGDGRADIALTGPSSWASVPVAFSNGDGSFNVANVFLANFPTWASTPSVQVLVGDFNGDGKADIALTGNPAWASLPVAFSNGDGTFRVTNAPLADFPTWASISKVVVGDFNGDGKMDVALSGGAGWTSVPVAFSKGDGTFTVTNQAIVGFGGWSTTPGVDILVGDWNGDQRTDLALTGVPGWSTLPLAFSLSTGVTP